MTRPLATFAAILVLTLVFPPAASAQTQADMNRSADSDFRRADSSLNTAYRQLLEAHRDDTLAVRKIRVAQRAWVAFRNAQLEAVFPADDKQTYGSMYPMEVSILATELTQQRTAQLRSWVGSDDASGVTLRCR